MVRIITLTCPTCGTIVAGNVLEDRREMRCPGLDCDAVLRFRDLTTAERDHLLDHRDRYTMEE